MSRRAWAALAGAAVVALAAGVYVALAGGTVGAPTVFIVVSALVLLLSVYLLARAGWALVTDAGGDEVQVATGRRRKELEREKQGLLKALKELEFDHEMRKISDADYREIAGLYRGRALQIMKRLDEAGVDYRRLVERDLAERLARAPGSGGDTARRGGASGDTARRGGAGGDTARRGGAGAAAGGGGVHAAAAVPASTSKAVAGPSTPARADSGQAACPVCETRNDADAVFCKKCGHRLRSDDDAAVERPS